MHTTSRDSGSSNLSSSKMSRRIAVGLEPATPILVSMQSDKSAGDRGGGLEVAMSGGQERGDLS
jgi:hypothetical protein